MGTAMTWALSALERAAGPCPGKDDAPPAGRPPVRRTTNGRAGRRSTDPAGTPAAGPRPRGARPLPQPATEPDGPADTPSYRGVRRAPGPGRGPLTCGDAAGAGPAPAGDEVRPNG